MLWASPSIPEATVGGLVAAGSHGTSLLNGSLSSQVVAITAVLANGTVMEFSAEKDPRLFKAMQVSVGRLGIITQVTLRQADWVLHSAAPLRTLGNKGVGVPAHAGCMHAPWSPCNMKSPCSMHWNG